MRMTKSLKYKVVDLIAEIKKNRTKHEKTYEEATKEYFKDLVEELQELLSAAGELIDQHYYITVEKPVQYLRDYDRALTMLEMTTESEIELDERTFAQLVMDEWDWREEFMNKTVNYVGAVRR